MDIKLPELPAQLGNLRDTQKIEVMRYARQAVREALENQEAVAWLCVSHCESGVTLSDYEAHLIKESRAYVVSSLAIIPAKEQQ